MGIIFIKPWAHWPREMTQFCKFNLHTHSTDISFATSCNIARIIAYLVLGQLTPVTMEQSLKYEYNLLIPKT